MLSAVLAVQLGGTVTLGTDGTGVSLIGAGADADADTGAGAEMGAGVKAGAVDAGAAAAGFDAWNRPLLGALVAGC